MSTFTDDDVLSQGFQPLRKIPTEPKQLTSGRRDSGRTSFYGDVAASPPTVQEREMEHALFEGSTFTRMERQRGRSMSRGNSFFKEDPVSQEIRARTLSVDMEVRHPPPSILHSYLPPKRHLNSQY